MNSIPGKILYNKVYHALINTKWLEENSINQRPIKSHIKSNAFIAQINKMIEDMDYSCLGVLKLCQGLMDGLSGICQPRDWLGYIYQYTLHKSFPGSVSIQLTGELSIACELYLKALRAVSMFQMSSGDNTWQSKYPLSFLTEKEEGELENPTEYRRFMQAFSDEYIYELMKLNKEVSGYNTIDHICGVHYLALSLGRQALKFGLHADLGRISGASCGHDIGKFGCRPNELKRVPYLHYYYTDQWFRKNDINYIRHVALNHSAWDLELENLSLESLILIYSDFRVKNVNGNMCILSLDESFDAVLKLLDNVNTAKEKRYRRVFAKLKDFENYMLHIGINVNIGPGPSWMEGSGSLNYSLLQGSEVVENIKYLAINHNINLMYQLRDEFSLDSILQLARSEKDWMVLREYIRVFQEYSTYFTQRQKLQTIRFLYDQLISPEEDIRRHCAELIGTLIAIYDEDYRKEIPEDVNLSTSSHSSVELFNEYVRLFLYPSHKIIPVHRTWIGYSTSIMVSSLFSRCSKLCGEYRKVLLSYYVSSKSKTRELQLYLLKTAENIPVLESDGSDDILFKFILQMLKKQSISLRLSALEAVNELLPNIPEGSRFREELKASFTARPSRSKAPAENFLRYKAAIILGMEAPIVERLLHYCGLDRKKVPDMFLSNLKTATDWVIKKVQVDILLEYTLDNAEKNGLHSAMHFCNLLKVSAVESVRTRAGMAILEIMPKLPLEQRNDVAVELLRALEIEGYHFTEYIPYYLGQLILWLQPVELDELIDDFIEKVKQANIQIKSLLLKTLGVCISRYHEYALRFPEKKGMSDSRLVKLLGILLNSLGDYNPHIKQAAFSVLGKEIFGTKNLTLEQKNLIFTLGAKKILTLMGDTKGEELQVLFNSASLNHIYRFVSDYTFFNGGIKLAFPEKIAFFPGTFDPFTLGHKQIVRAIRDMGYEVYLAVDEFSWSKRTLPNQLRRRIINMSIADELNIYIYPENCPVNIANPDDLARLRSNFPNSKIYMVVGSDVILNASSYNGTKKKNSLQSFPHIIIERDAHISHEKVKKYQDIIRSIDGEVIELTLPMQYKGISSTQIRSYIDENRDISSLVDPMVQQYIYDHGFYQREPQDKTLLQSSLSMNIIVEEDFNTRLIDELSSFIDKKKDEMAQRLVELSKKSSSRLVLIRDGSQGGRLMGFTALHRVRTDNLHMEFKDSYISQYIRENTVGRIVLIECIFAESLQKNNLVQILLTEALSFALSTDYQYAIYFDMLENGISSPISETLKLQGFRELNPEEGKNPIYIVDMTNPCILNMDTETLIKEPFRSNIRVKQAVSQSRKKLQEALTRLYPGELVLSFDIGIQHEKLIKKICSENGVPANILTPRRLGPAMCVPYGNILDRYVVPNTVTKALHTEKLFNPDMKSFTISQFPHYLSLDIQVKTIGSFNRSVILVDDLLHKGYRMKALDPIFKREGIQIQKIIVGILSGRGKELMDRQGRQVDGVYFIPRLHLWFNENSLYPFIGGDALWRGEPERNLLPSINLILPYTSPAFIRGASKSSIYNLSLTAIENSINILSTLESEYHILNERNLTLANLGQVFVTPRCPDHGKNLEYDLNLSASFYLRNDMELLKRLEIIINRD